MNTPRTQEALRKLKIQLLQWRINRTLDRMAKADNDPDRAQYIKLFNTLMQLVHVRNSLRTHSEIAQIESERGLA
ncbi:hypothetical protein RE428_32180 [Marinobacter nanhaiticus D15-8W]|uniref:Uncharacterized protein n=1 Tax=Marinobacter nanhaiticus D15-8W TaxID=626887 RepID=N6W2Z0_9GAMM|nr:hypothetical protein [Marinobacter nanhaiticus]ENO16910.1 hypothetical protein J057_01860 [Marinobacter nanhaiticus D15-8W]BES72200.1 hypothetical protein RE428_32180 [Marinobacter nanhaiticus D15-8W]